MQPNQKLDKQRERQLMQDLMRVRETRTPRRQDPDWVHRFWKRLAS